MLQRNALFMLFFIFILSLLSACDSQENKTAIKPSTSKSQKEEKPVPVILAPIEFEQQLREVHAVGTARATKSVTLYSESSGIVTQVNFKAGQYVKKDELLLTLEDDDERLALDLAKIELKDAQRELVRYQQTINAGAVTRRVLDEADSRAERAKIELRQAELDESRRLVKAPFNGYVGISDIEVGALISDLTAITTIDDRSRLLISFQLPELFHGEVIAGQSIEMTTWANKQLSVSAKIVEVDSRVSLETRTFEIRAELSNDKDILRPGMSFRINLRLAGDSYPKIPETALQWGGDGAFVWEVRDQRTYRVPATIVQRLPGFILVDAPLMQNAQVVREGVQNLREGALIHAHDS